MHTKIGHIDHIVQTSDTRMEDKPPSQLNSWVKLHVHGPTHVAHEVACTPSSTCSLLYTLELHALPLPGLRIKTRLSHHFGIIINYDSQGLKPLRLSPLSNLAAPFPLPNLWKLSPPSLFLRGQSAHNDVYILLMICIITYTKIKLLPFNT
jgi:hypothetical protein